MTEFTPARPRYTLTLGGTDYPLLGTFELLEAVEVAAKDGILAVIARCMDLSLHETARVISAMLTASGHATTPAKVGKIIVEEVGITGDGFALLKLHVYAALRVFVSPPPKREETATAMGEMIGAFTAPPASPGTTTSSSPSASSTGRRKPSGKQRPGT